MAASRSSITASVLIVSPNFLVIEIAMVFQSVRDLALFAGRYIRDLAASIENWHQSGVDGLAPLRGREWSRSQNRDFGVAVTRASLTAKPVAFDAVITRKDLLTNSGQTNVLDATRRRLTCNPLAGNAARCYAVIHGLASGPGATLIHARWSTTPSATGNIEARPPFATSLRSSEVARFEAKYLSDLERFVTHKPADRAGATHAATTPHVKALLHPLIDAETDARKKTMIAALVASALSCSPCNTYVS